MAVFQSGALDTMLLLRICLPIRCLPQPLPVPVRSKHNPKNSQSGTVYNVDMCFGHRTRHALEQINLQAATKCVQFSKIVYLVAAAKYFRNTYSKGTESMADAGALVVTGKNVWEHSLE